MWRRGRAGTRETWAVTGAVTGSLGMNLQGQALTGEKNHTASAPLCLSKLLRISVFSHCQTQESEAKTLGQKSEMTGWIRWQRNIIIMFYLQWSKSGIQSSSLRLWKREIRHFQRAKDGSLEFESYRIHCYLSKMYKMKCLQPLLMCCTCFYFNYCLGAVMGQLVVRSTSPLFQLVNCPARVFRSLALARLSLDERSLPRTRQWTCRTASENIMKWNMGIPCIFSFYSPANLYFVCFPCADLSHEGPPSLSTTPFAGCEPACVRKAHHLFDSGDIVCHNSCPESMRQRGLLCHFCEMVKWIQCLANLHWICTNRKQASVLSAWCNLETEYSRLLGNRFELCGSTCMQSVFSCKHCHTAQSGGWLELWMWRNHIHHRTTGTEGRWVPYTSVALHRAGGPNHQYIAQELGLPGGPC